MLNKKLEKTERPEFEPSIPDIVIHALFSHFIENNRKSQVITDQKLPSRLTKF